MNSSSNIKSEQRLLKELNETLATLPQVKLLKFDVQPAKSNDLGVDAKAEIETKNKKKIEILVQFKASAYPRDLERVVKELKEYKQKIAGTVTLIVSQAISPGARKMLQDEGIGYFDAGGSLYLPYFDGIYFIDRPPPAPERKLQNMYEGKAAQVLQILLDNPDREWHVNGLAEEAEVSPYTVHHVFTNLEKQSIVERQGRGPECVRILKRPGELLDTWEENYSYKHYKFLNFYKWSQSTVALRDEIARTLKTYKIDYALTLGSGAELVAPFVTGSERLHFVVEDSIELDEAIKAAGLESVEDGAVVTFMTTGSRSPLLTRRKIGDLYVAGDVQLYLDLSKWKARGREQAEHLRRERLKF